MGNFLSIPISYIDDVHVVYHKSAKFQHEKRSRHPFSLTRFSSSSSSSSSSFTFLLFFEREKIKGDLSQLLVELLVYIICYYI